MHLKNIIIFIMTIIIIFGCTLDDDPDPIEKVTLPVFSVPGGMYPGDINVALSCTTPGASIYYTIDGTIPDSSSSLYSAPVTISGNHTTMTLTAVAVKEGMDDSDSAEETYSIEYDLVAAPAFSPAAGTYEDAVDVTITCGTEGARIYYTTNGDNPDISSTLYTEVFSITENTTIKAVAVKEGMADSDIVTAGYVIKCAAPVFSPVSGTYDGPLDITITCGTEGARIYYTTDGTGPTVDSPVYSGGITIPVDSPDYTITACAGKDGMILSDSVTAVYTTVPGGVYVDGTNTSGVEDGSYTHPYNTIQEGINAANTGDTIWVAPGTYMENLLLKSDIRLQGAGAAVTTIDGSAGGNYSYVMTIPDTYHHDITIDGFTITGTCYKGICNGGLYATMDLSAITISNNIFDGIGYYDTSDHRWNGFAIHLLVIDNSTFHNNLIINHPNYSMAIVLGQDLTITNNVIADNFYGLNISNPESTTINIKNNIITNNEVRGITISNNDAPAQLLSYNNVWNNGHDNYYNSAPGTGSISLDPLFADPENNDYTLRALSPCINAGDPDPLYNDSDGTRNDMGAYGGPDSCLSRGPYNDNEEGSV